MKRSYFRQCKQNRQIRPPWPRYRNFPHRQVIYEAVLERDLKSLSQQIAETPAKPLAFIRHMAELMRVYDRSLGQLVEMADYDAAKNQRYIAEALGPALARAQDLGLLRPELTAPDILMACRMLASNWRLDDEADFESSFAKRLALILRGLGVPPEHATRNSQASRPKESL